MIYTYERSDSFGVKAKLCVDTGACPAIVSYKVEWPAHVELKIRSGCYDGLWLQENMAPGQMYSDLDLFYERPMHTGVCVNSLGHCMKYPYPQGVPSPWPNILEKKPIENFLSPLFREAKGFYDTVMFTKEAFRVRQMTTSLTKYMFEPQPWSKQNYVRKSPEQKVYQKMKDTFPAGILLYSSENPFWMEVQLVPNLFLSYMVLNREQWSPPIMNYLKSKLDLL